MVEQEMRPNLEIFINLMSFSGSFFKVVWLPCPSETFLGTPSPPFKINTS